MEPVDNHEDDDNRVNAESGLGVARYSVEDRPQEHADDEHRNAPLYRRAETSDDEEQRAVAP